MKKLFILFLISFSLIVRGQVVDILPDNIENYRFYEGGSKKVLIDKKTPLKTLIERLNTSWELEVTFKCYWIGYTNDMYSIAAHKNKAIQPLLNFIKYSKNNKSKLGAIYCLHLIGIDSKIVGRFNEEFVNAKARQALLSLIFQQELTDLVVSLLARDPWRTDLPILIHYLKYYPLNLKLINSLFRYEKSNAPFRQDINENNDKLPVFLHDSTGLHRIGTYNGITKKFHANSWSYSHLKSNFKCTTFDISNGPCEDLQNKLYDFTLLSKEKVSIYSYCDLTRDNFHHFVVEGRILVICTPEQTLKRWRQFYANK